MHIGFSLLKDLRALQMMGGREKWVAGRDGCGVGSPESRNAEQDFIIEKESRVRPVRISFLMRIWRHRRFYLVVRWLLGD